MSDSVGVVVPAFRPDVDQLRAYVAAIDDALSPAAVVVELDDPRKGVPASLADLPAEIETVPYRRGRARPSPPASNDSRPTSTPSSTQTPPRRSTRSSASSHG